MKMIRTIIRKPFIQIILLTVFALASTVQAAEITKTYGECRPGLHLAPKGPFAAILFCEDALGSYLGVVYYKNMEAPLDGQWQIADRFWQEPNWSADVTSFAWDSKGINLFVSTSMIYGTGDIYRLDLRNKKAIRIFPLGKYAEQMEKGERYCITSINSIDESNRNVEITLTSCEDKNEVKLKIDY